MQLEIIAFWSLFCLILIFLAEMRPQFRILGILGCLLLIPLAFWINDSGVEIQTGQTTTITTVTNTTLSGTTTTGSMVDTGQNTAWAPPYFQARSLLFMILMGLSIFGMLTYTRSIVSGISAATGTYGR